MVRRWKGGAAGARVVPWAVLAVGLATTLGLDLSIGRALRRRHAEEFDRATARLTKDLKSLVGDQVAVLHATAGLLDADPEVGRDGFAAFCRELRSGGPARLTTVVGLSLRRPWERRGELAEAAARRGVARFAPFPSSMAPGDAHAVVLVEPQTPENLRVVGYDMHSEARRRAAMDRARDEAQAVLTSRVVLAQDRSAPRPPASILIYLPLYEGGPAATPQARRARLRGHVYSGLRGAEMLKGLKGRLFAERVGLRLWAGDDETGDELYAFGNPLRDEALRSRASVVPSGVGGRLEARFFPVEGFGSAATIRPWVLPVGFAISALLFLLARSLGRAQEASERRAAEQALIAEAGQLTPEGAGEGSLADLARSTSAILDAVCRIDLLEDGVLRTVSTRADRHEALAELERAYPRLQHDRLLRKALETGTTQRAPEYPTVDEAHRALVERLGVGPVVVVPMRSRGRAVGALTLTRPKGGLALAPEAVALAGAVADRVALAVDNLRLYRAAQGEIEERRAAEAEVRRLNEGLEDIVAERTRDLEASNHELESFCYSVSHDLRTPLRSLDGFGRALKEDYGDALDEQAHDYIDRIRAATKRMDELITALLTLSRLTRRDIVPAPVDVAPLAREIMDDLDPAGRAEFAVQEGLRVHADPRMLAVALENLLSNAVKFTGRTERPRIEVGSTGEGEIYVRDNGAGFDPAYGAKLFQPFERLHSVREFPGHGIGLATVERILRRHGGTVRAEGKPGEGATFYLRLPE